MKSPIVCAKRILLGASLVLAFGAVPVLASPSLTDQGSNGYMVYVAGDGFTPNTSVYVAAYDSFTNVLLQSGWVTTDFWGCTQYGCLGGSFQYSGADTTRCSGVGREVWAWDSASLSWTGPLHVRCFTDPW